MENNMNKWIRPFLIFVSAGQFFFAVAFFFQWSFATDLWPFPGTTPLTFIFVASIFAAAAAPTLWVAINQRFDLLAGIGLDYLTILTPMTVILFRLSANGEARMAGYGIVCLFGALFGLVLFVWGLRIPMKKTLPTPGLVRGAFVFFIIALLIVSTRLLLQIPTIPWALTPELSLLVGWMFIGAAFYFVYGLLRPDWMNAAGQLLGFLAYDIVLIVPFIKRLPNTPAEQMNGMVVYTLVVIFSGLLAVYYLFLSPKTRAQTWSG
jgi:hypothetical protein